MSKNSGIQQQVIIEFGAMIADSFNKAFEGVIASINKVAQSQKTLIDSMKATASEASRAEQAIAGMGVNTEKTEKKMSKFQKALNTFKSDFSAQGAGIKSVGAAMEYYAKGVEKGDYSLASARRKTKEYIDALNGTNSVLAASKSSWKDWSKTVDFAAIKQAENAGKINITRNGIQLLDKSVAESLGITKEMWKALEGTTIRQDLYAKKLRESALQGDAYAASFQKMSRSYGTSNGAVAVWSKNLENAQKGVMGLNKQLTSSGVASSSLTQGLNLSSIAANLMRDNLSKTGKSFKIYNEAGLRSLNLTVEQAAQMGMLAKSFGSYGTTLQSMIKKNSDYTGTFKSLTNTYGKSTDAVAAVNKAIKETEALIGGQITKKTASLNAEVAKGTKTQAEATKELENYKRTLDPTAVAMEKMKVATNGLDAAFFAGVKNARPYQVALQNSALEAAKAGVSTEQYRKALSAVEDSIKKTAKGMTAGGRNGDAFAASANRAVLTQNLLNTALDRGSNRLQINNGYLGASANHLEKAVQPVNMLSAAWDKVSTSLVNVAKYAVGATMFYGMATTVMDVGRQIINFDQALKDLQAITKATDAETLKFGDTIKDVASKTKFSAQEVADGMKFLGQAGFTASETIMAIEAVATLATGTLSDFATTADLVTTTIRAFHMQAGDTVHLVDMFANAINRSKLDVDKLRVAFNYFASVADKANISVEDSLSLMGLLANAGVRASTIGTSLRQVVEELVSPSKAFNEAMKAAGYTAEQMDPQLNSLEDVIGRLQVVVNSAGKAFDLFGLRGAPAVSAITSAGVDGFMKMKKEVIEAGAAAEMAEKQMEGLGNRSKNLKDNVELLYVALGEAGLKQAMGLLIGVLRSVVVGLTAMVSVPVVGWTLALTAAGYAVLGVFNVGKAFVALPWVATFLKAAFSVEKLTTAFVFLKSAIIGSNTAALASLGVWGLIAVAVAGVAYAAYKYHKAQKTTTQLAEEEKKALDKKIAADKQSQKIANGLIATAKDASLTDAQRTQAIDKLIARGIKVNGVLRDQQGIITNLNEVVEKSADSFATYTAELSKYIQQKEVQKISADIKALVDAQKQFEEAYTARNKAQKDLKENYGVENTERAVFEKPLEASGENLKTAQEKFEEVIMKFSTMEFTAWKEVMMAAGASETELNKFEDTYDSMDSKFAIMWAKQSGHVEQFVSEGVTDLMFLASRFDAAMNQIRSTSAYKRAEILREGRKVQEELEKQLPKATDTGPKDKDRMTRELEVFRKIREQQIAESIQFSDKTIAIEGLTNAQIKEEKDRAQKEQEDITLRKEEDIDKRLKIVQKFIDQEAQFSEIAAENRIAALEAKSAMEIGIEYDTSNEILGIRRQILATQMAADQQMLNYYSMYAKDNIEEIDALKIKIAQAQQQINAMDAGIISNKMAKAADERDRAEKARAYKLNADLLDIELEYWDQDNELSYQQSMRTIAFYDNEIALQQAYIDERMRNNQRVYEEEERLKNLQFQQDQERARLTQMINENNIKVKDEKTDSKTSLLGTMIDVNQGSLEEQRALGLEKLQLENAQEYSEKERHLNSLIMLQSEKDAILENLRRQHEMRIAEYNRQTWAAEYQQKAEFFGEMSDLMGEFYSATGEKMKAFLIFQKALAVAQIIMNTMQQAAAAGAQTGIFGIPMQAMIMATGMARAGIVAGTAVAELSMADGGKVPGYSPSPTADNIQANLTAEEWVHPVATGKYYGDAGMEAIRTRSIPREVIQSYAKKGHRTSSNNFAEGGKAEAPTSSGGREKEERTLQIVNVLDPAMFDQYIASTAGTKSVMNLISRNKNQFRGILGS